MTTERILKRISIIQKNNKNNGKIKTLIAIVQTEIEKIPNFSQRDSLEEKLTRACCH